MDTWTALLIVLLLVVLVLVIIWIIKNVFEAALTVATDKTDYEDSETVTISGTLSDPNGGIQGETVALVVAPPTGDDIVLDSVTTDSAGQYSQTLDLAGISGGAPAGTYTVHASALQETAETTFKMVQVRKKCIPGQAARRGRANPKLNYRTQYRLAG